MIVTDQYYIHEEIRSRLNYEMLAIIQFRMFRIPVSYLRM